MEFASFLGVNKSLYNHWEKQHGQPNRESCMKLAKKLKCKVEDLFEESPE
jgi:DNA-binding XRE family transcriptional regulator